METARQGISVSQTATSFSKDVEDDAFKLVMLENNILVHASERVRRISSTAKN